MFPPILSTNPASIHIFLKIVKLFCLNLRISYVILSLYPGMV